MISNRETTWLQRLFALEYAALFRGLLPVLARHGLAFPLGGTSNHFDVSALRRSGGWDPFNVTEDADLGLRLARAGYRLATITRPTFEDAPATLRDRIGQRTRWFKGWMQTWLVMMRAPLTAWRDLGTASFLVMQVLMAGMIASSLCHPVVAISLAVMIMSLFEPNLLEGVRGWLFVIDALNIAVGYLAFIILGLLTLTAAEFRMIRPAIIAVPLYWLAMSWAAWRALGQIVRRPHFWEKTPHRQAYAVSGAMLKARESSPGNR